jgi:uncharacterized protein YecE (DUF72 family)
MNKNRIYIGTSGFSYKHWRDIFYPADIKQNEWLEYYTNHFNTVELNVTFYRLPRAATFEKWFKKVPDNFRFVLKGSRMITHLKRLKNCQEALDTFFQRAGILKHKLMAVLWQFPPSFKANIYLLSNFIKLLNNKKSPCLHSFEFRHESWFTEKVYKILNNHNMNLCIADSPRFPCATTLTSSFVYLRFHGGKKLYSSKYTSQELKQWAEKLKLWVKNKDLLLAYFNNDAQAFAIKNARQLKVLINQSVQLSEHLL